MAKTVRLPWDYVLHCDLPENQPVAGASCEWPCVGRVVFCFKRSYMFLWQKRHDFKSTIVFLPRGLVAWWEHRILELWYSHCHGPNDAIALDLCYPVIGQKTSCAVAPCGWSYMSRIAI
jgi:hypothetical protein